MIGIDSGRRHRRPGLFRPESRLVSPELPATFAVPFTREEDPALERLREARLKGQEIEVPATWQEFGPASKAYDRVTYMGIARNDAGWNLLSVGAMVLNVSADNVRFKILDETAKIEPWDLCRHGFDLVIPNHRILAQKKDGEVDIVLFRGVVNMDYVGSHLIPTCFVDEQGYVQKRQIAMCADPMVLGGLHKNNLLQEFAPGSVEEFIDQTVRPECKRGMVIDRSTLATYVKFYSRN